jgi:hypothetical protein
MWDDVITELKVAALYGRLDLLDVHASYCEHGGELTHAAATTAWCEDSADLLEVACALAPRDRDRLRSHLAPFLANLNYRRAAEMDASIAGRLRGGWTVFRTTGVLPKLPYWLKHVVADRPWYRVLARGKRVGIGLLRAQATARAFRERQGDGLPARHCAATQSRGSVEPQDPTQLEQSHRP